MIDEYVSITVNKNYCFHCVSVYWIKYAERWFKRCFWIVLLKFASFYCGTLKFFLSLPFLSEQFNDLIYIEQPPPLLSICALLAALCVRPRSKFLRRRAGGAPRASQTKTRRSWEREREREKKHGSISLNRDATVTDDRPIGSPNNAENAARTPERFEDGGFREERAPARLRAISAHRGRETEILRIREVWKGWQKMFKVKPCRLQERPARVPQQLQKMNRNWRKNAERLGYSCDFTNIYHLHVIRWGFGKCTPMLLRL